jgi:hypothetical protein
VFGGQDLSRGDMIDDQVTALRRLSERAGGHDTTKNRFGGFLQSQIFAHRRRLLFLRRSQRAPHWVRDF